MPEGWRLCFLLILLCILTWRSQTSLAPRFWFGDGENGEVMVYVDGAQASLPRVGGGAGTRLALGLPVMLNSATTSELEMVPGIGPRTATKIVSRRQSHGCFVDVAALTHVKGIGRKMLSKLGPYISVRQRPGRACAAARHG